MLSAWESKPRTWRKVMAAYHWVYDCHLQTDVVFSSDGNYRKFESMTRKYRSFCLLTMHPGRICN